MDEMLVGVEERIDQGFGEDDAGKPHEEHKGDASGYGFHRFPSKCVTHSGRGLRL